MHNQNTSRNDVAHKPRLISYFLNDKAILGKAESFAYNQIIISFVLSKADNPFQLTTLGDWSCDADYVIDAETTEIITRLKKSGKKILVAFGGGSVPHNMYASLAGHETKIANEIAKFIQTNQLDGVDIDWEDSKAFVTGQPYNAIDFLVKLTDSLRTLLPKGAYIISHAPQPPYLSKVSSMNGYLAILEQAGPQIDQLNMQYYNNPPWSANPKLIVETYLNYITYIKNFDPKNIILGFPAQKQDAGSGYMPVEQIINEVIYPIQKEMPIGGLFNWALKHDEDGKWADAIAKAIFK